MADEYTTTVGVDDNIDQSVGKDITDFDPNKKHYITNIAGMSRKDRRAFNRHRKDPNVSPLQYYDTETGKIALWDPNKRIGIGARRKYRREISDLNRLLNMGLTNLSLELSLLLGTLNKGRNGWNKNVWFLINKPEGATQQTSLVTQQTEFKPNLSYISLAAGGNNNYQVTWPYLSTKPTATVASSGSTGGTSAATVTQGSTNGTGAVKTTRSARTFGDSSWDRAAKSAGLNSYDLVRSWQGMIGLSSDGHFGPDSLARAEALKNAGYTYKLNNDNKTYSLYLNDVKAEPASIKWKGNEIVSGTPAPKLEDQWYTQAGLVGGNVEGNSYIIKDFNGKPIKTYTRGTDGNITYSISDGNDISRVGTYDPKSKTHTNTGYTRGDGTPLSGVRIGNNSYMFAGLNRLKSPRGFGYRIFNGKLQEETSQKGWKDLDKDSYSFFKQGGQIQKYKQGGNMLDEELELIYAALGYIGYAYQNNKQIDFQTALAEVMQLALSGSNSNALNELANNELLVKNGVKVMQEQDPETLEKIKQPEGINEILNDIQNQLTQMARMGAKLNYIKSLKGICPEGYEVVYMKAGGIAGCPVCLKKHLQLIDSAKCGKKVSKKLTGGVSKTMNNIKSDLMECGGKSKVKKNEKPSGPIKPKKITNKDDKYKGLTPNDTIHSDDGKTVIAVTDFAHYVKGFPFPRDLKGRELNLYWKEISPLTPGEWKRYSEKYRKTYGDGD